MFATTNFRQGIAKFNVFIKDKQIKTKITISQIESTVDNQKLIYMCVCVWVCVCVCVCVWLRVCVSVCIMHIYDINIYKLKITCITYIHSTIM